MLNLKIYTYNNTSSLKKYISEFSNENINFILSSELNENLLDNEYVVDVSSLVQALDKTNGKIDYEVEQLILHYNKKYNIKFIVKEELVDIILEHFPLIFSGKEPLFNYNVGCEQKIYSKDNIIKLKDIEDEEFEKMIDSFNEKLIGHNKFKSDLAKHLKEFRLFNKIGEHKILSIFLFGTSGIGKTQVARILHQLIAPAEKMIKLNFGNYSSEGALNSLIGSPRGFVGSEDGELNTKLRKSLSSVILVDEFEKCAKAVSNFFLELLEEGKYTDMLGEEHDLNGYIIVFTSNIAEDKIDKDIPLEFLNRLNYICKFNFLNEEDKMRYLKSRVNELVDKFNLNNNFKIDEESKKILTGINVSEYESIRAIENEIKKRFIDVVDKLENTTNT